MRTTGRIGAGIATVALAAIIAGCTPGGTDEPARPAEPDPALVALGAALDEEGALPLDVAQRIFAATVAPLPGVEPFEADGAGELPPEFAALAIRRLSASLGELPPGVADAVLDVVEPAADEEEVVVEPGARLRGEGESGVVPDELPGRDELQALIAGIVADLEARTGHDLRIPVRARIAPQSRIRALGVADAVWTDASSTRARACRIALADGLFGMDAASITSTIAHEVWHCFQYDASPRAGGHGPLWLIEGQAEYVGEAYAGGSPSSAERWDTWLLTPDSRLPGRSYDAIGLYAAATRTGEVWTRLLPMLDRGLMAAVETLFASSAQEALQAHAAALVRAPEFGAEWESTGPGITDARTELRMPVDAGEAVETRGRVGRFGALPVRLQILATEVLEIAFDGGAGVVELPGVDATRLPAGGRIVVCLDEGGCVCPDGEPLGLPQSQPGEGVAAVGSVEGGEVAVVATPTTIEEACDRSPLVGEWTTDVANVMAALGNAYGPVPTCTGPWVATFREDGTWSAGYSATCSFAGQAGQARAAFTGTYVDERTSFTVANIRGEGTMTLNGVTMPLPIVDGFRQALGGRAEYTILGDVLTYIVVTPEGNRVPVSLHRAG